MIRYLTNSSICIAYYPYTQDIEDIISLYKTLLNILMIDPTLRPSRMSMLTAEMQLNVQPSGSGAK